LKTPKAESQGKKSKIVSHRYGDECLL